MNNFAALILASIGTIVILAVGWYVLLAIAYWKIFEKAGRTGLEGFDPILQHLLPVQIHLEPEYVLDRTGLLLTWRSVSVPQKVLYSYVGTLFTLASAIVNIIAANKLSKALDMA